MEVNTMDGFYDNDTNRRQFVNHIVKFDKDQLFEINLGHMLGLSVDQINLYARPRFNYLIMRLLKDCLINRMDFDKVKFMADPKFNWSLMVIIRDGFNHGLSIDQVKKYADPELDYNKACEIMRSLVAESK